MGRNKTSSFLNGLCGRVCAAFLAMALLAGCQSSQLTSEGLLPPSQPVAAMAFSQIERRGQSALVIDYATGQTLYEDQPDALRYPASLTKMMTLYLLFEAVRSGQLSLDTQLVVSENAASKPPSKLGLKPGETIPVSLAMTALAVRSANDVATVVAENLGGTEEAFANAMTRRAQGLGMNRTRFANASGLPDPAQASSARDMAILGRALYSRFPEYTNLFKLTSYEYNGRTYRATNKLLGTVRGVDGIKTGYINDAGSHLVATVERGGRRLIVVVLGGESARKRDAQVSALIERYAGAGS
ncbi:D-alanyl-D-alanine carboxypeptidase family protein [Fulvimarina sp. 2208YS6-2-32]|uniref:D-alanyl-D-alanine carboxypeptidase family protein n=1 Tax=Fulvimarina uroteuthidis TaxID=3098149 RepID=A0ABU5I4I7_9HYPH|nr:D-alanyl-D-alanine carboxypeptidase family protein [Fulvimarina sp. 2208YS6-2-32]MDY8110005.1 D-alanyl-D-alanine carboxypeptidase family protein [Fulvimarina sp. 2208YS6-2-32]